VFDPEASLEVINLKLGHEVVFLNQFCVLVQKPSIMHDVLMLTCSRWFLSRGFFYPDDGGDTFLRNVGSHKNYTAPHPKKRHIS
jgi:hypothetical protein